MLHFVLQAHLPVPCHLQLHPPIALALPLQLPAPVALPLQLHPPVAFLCSYNLFLSRYSLFLSSYNLFLSSYNLFLSSYNLFLSSYIIQLLSSPATSSSCFPLQLQLLLITDALQMQPPVVFALQTHPPITFPLHITTYCFSLQLQPLRTSPATGSCCIPSPATTSHHYCCISFSS